MIYILVSIVSALSKPLVTMHACENVYSANHIHGKKEEVWKFLVELLSLVTQLIVSNNWPIINMVRNTKL